MFTFALGNWFHSSSRYGIVTLRISCDCRALLLSFSVFREMA